MQHQDLAGGRWFKLSLVEQMANIGSEIERALKWRDKNKTKLAHNAHIRALELFDLTLNDVRHHAGLKEIARARELWCDFFVGRNQYRQTPPQWRKYFFAFTYAARNQTKARL